MRLLQNGNVETAKQLVEKALRLNPYDSMVWGHFATIEASLENYTRARAMFNRSVELNPKDWRSWDLWSAMEHKLGNIEQAEKLLQESFRIRFHAEGDFSILANKIDDRTT